MPEELQKSFRVPRAELIVLDNLAILPSGSSVGYMTEHDTAVS